MRILLLVVLACLAPGLAYGDPDGAPSPFAGDWRLGAALEAADLDGGSSTVFDFTPRSVGRLSIERIEFSVDAQTTPTLADDALAAAPPGEDHRFTVGGAVAIEGIELAGAASRLEGVRSVGEAYSARVGVDNVGARMGYAEWETAEGRNLERFSLGAEFLGGDALSVDAGLALTQEEDRETDATGAIRLRLSF
jgi:hypothetical protein